MQKHPLEETGWERDVQEPEKHVDLNLTKEQAEQHEAEKQRELDRLQQQHKTERADIAQSLDRQGYGGLQAELMQQRHINEVRQLHERYELAHTQKLEQRKLEAKHNQDLVLHHSEVEQQQDHNQDFTARDEQHKRARTQQREKSNLENLPPAKTGSQAKHT